MVSSGLIDGFFRVHLLVFDGSFRASCRVSYQDFLGFFWVSLGVSLGFHLGYKQTRIKQKKMKNKKTVKTGSKEAKEQGVEQQKHMTEEKKIE